MNSISMKLLVILNESPAGAHTDLHAALSRLKANGVLESYIVYPFLARLNEGETAHNVVSEIVNTAKELEPKAILWSHTGGLQIDPKSIEELKNICSRPVMGYWDGDMYQEPHRPIPKNQIKLIQNCHVSFWVGYSNSLEKLKKAGCRDLRYVPSTTDEQRFGKLRNNGTKIIYDVVLVGNHIMSKLPWRQWPGARWRNEIVTLLSKKLGERFAVFGNGWKISNSKGPIPFNEQYKVYHQSRVVVAVNNINTDLFFSNRLPIVLSSGVPLVHNYENGLDEIFQGLSNPIFFKTTEEVWNKIQILLEKEQSELDDIAAPAYHFAMEKLTMKNVLSYIIQVLNDYMNIAVSNHDSHNLTINPWITKYNY